MDRDDGDDGGAAYIEFLETVAGGALLEHVYGKPTPVDVGQLMIDGVVPPTMVVDGWIVAEELHWIYADPEAGKTWLGLKLCIAIINHGGTVVYFDEELGENVIAERLLALGADPQLVRERFVYAPFPSWQMADEDVAAHRAFLRLVGPKLVVYDTATDMLSEAELDENSGIEVTQWIKAYPEQARRAGAAQLVLDHVGHGDKARAVGTRAKRSKAKVQFSLKATARYDRTTLGKVEVELRKNTRSAPLDHRRTFQVGGTVDADGAERFVWEALPLGPGPSEKVDAVARARERVLAEAPVGRANAVNNTQLKKLVGGNSATVGKAIDELVEHKLIKAAANGRSVLYWREP